MLQSFPNVKTILRIAMILGLVTTVTRSASYGQDSSALINQALDQQVKLEFTDTTLPDAMATIGRETGVRIEADPAVWDLLPWGQQTTIKRAKIEHQTLRQAMEAITGKLGLIFVLKAEAVELQPTPALRRLGRRATAQELQALDLLSSTPMGLKTDRPTVKQLVEAVDLKLADLKVPFAIEYRPGEGMREDHAVSIPRNATMAEALESLAADTNLTWYPWGKSLLVVPKEDQIRNQLAKTITTRYRGVDVSQVLTELASRAGVAFDMEPGAIQRITPELRNIDLSLDNASIRQTLETIAGFTGLTYSVTPNGIYISNPSRSPGARDPIVGIITLPDVNMQVLVPQSQVPAEMREYLKLKTHQQLEKVRQLMKDEHFVPTTQPAPTSNEDL